MSLWLVCLWPAMWAVPLQMLSLGLGFSITGRQDHSLSTSGPLCFVRSRGRENHGNKFPGQANGMWGLAESRSCSQLPGPSHVNTIWPMPPFPLLVTDLP